VPLGGGGAFTKDTVYLHGLLAVHTFFRWCLRQRELDRARRLFAGKMALEDVGRLAPAFEAGVIAPPRYLPPWMRRANGLAGVLAFSLFANRIRLDQVQAADLILGEGLRDWRSASSGPRPGAVQDASGASKRAPGLEREIAHSAAAMSWPMSSNRGVPR